MATAVERRRPPMSSRTPSVRSESLTPHATPPPTSSAQSSSKFSKLKSMLNSNPGFAVFDAHVTIHELSNVPQLEGQFSVRWKFRGSRPRDADRYLTQPVPRRGVVERPAPNTNMRTLRPSGSVMSLRTTSTASTSTTGTSTTSALVAPQSLGSKPRHAASLPVPSPPTHPTSHPVSHSSSMPSPLGRNATLMADPTTSRPPRLRGKKGSDPTPLRQQTDDNGRDIVEEPEDLGDAESRSDDAPTSSVPTLTTESAGSSRAQSVHSLTPSLYSVTPSINTTASGPSVKPFPSGLGLTGAGGASTPSLASRSSTIPVTDDLRRRVPSRASTRSDLSLTIDPTLVASHNRIPAAAPIDSSERKGQTPMCTIRSHTITWEYRLENVLRVPLGKPVAVPSSGGSHSRHPSPTPDKKSLPVLGGGPQSDSGIKLEILQAPREGEKDTEPKLFGYVNIDLAPFADSPPMARKFLLKDSKANATLRVSVDMRFIGGEQDWVAPPMQEGHLVAVADLTGEEYQELQLLPTPSISSNSDLSSHSANPPSHRSAHTGVGRTKQPHAYKAASHASRHRYRSFEHHLQPEQEIKPPRAAHSRSSDSNRSYPRPQRTYTSDFASLSPTSPTMSRVAPQEVPYTTSPSSTPTFPETQLPMLDTKFKVDKDADGTLGYFERVPSGYGAFGATLSPVTTRFDTSRMDATAPLSPTSPILGGLTSPEWSPPNNHNHHSHYLLDDTDGDLQPDLVIESVFNPAVGDEFSPFTYIPGDDDGYDDGGRDEDDTGTLDLDVDNQAMAMEHLDVGHHAWSRLRRRVKSNPCNK